MPRLEVEISDALERFLAHQEAAGHPRGDLVTLALAAYARSHNLTHVLHPAKRDEPKKAAPPPAAPKAAKATAAAAPDVAPAATLRTDTIIEARLHGNGGSVVLKVAPFPYHPRPSIIIDMQKDVDPRSVLERYIALDDRVHQLADLVGREITFDIERAHMIANYFRPIERNVG